MPSAIYLLLSLVLMVLSFGMDLLHPENLQPLTQHVISQFEGPLGRFVMATAQLDLTMNFLIFETHPIIAQMRLAKAPPRMLGDKIDLLIKLCQSTKQPEILRSALRHAQEARRLNDLRSYVVHGALSGCIPGEMPSLYFLKADYSKTAKSYQGKSRLVSIRELVDAGLSVTVAANGLDEVVKVFRAKRISASAK